MCWPVDCAFSFFFFGCSEESHINSLILKFLRSTPEGLEDVSKYPDLLAALLEDPSWSEEDVKKLAGLNLLRVFAQVEEVSPLIEWDPKIRLHVRFRGCR